MVLEMQLILFVKDTEQVVLVSDYFRTFGVETKQE